MALVQCVVLADWRAKRKLGFEIARDLKWLSKKRSDCVTFFCYNTYAAILFSEYYYDKRYK
jgi:hypothetical protein